MWSYERGTLQYDIICALILAFIFLVPPSCFFAKKIYKPQFLNQSSQISQPEVKNNRYLILANENK
jgi:hypothetical protein